MQTKITPLYRKKAQSIHIPLHIVAIFIALVSTVPLNVIGSDPLAPYQQEFLLTAYYSPIEGQCCYVKGGLHADRILNGQGFHGADGTAVYPGMIAAPPSYPFGTRIVLPGIGTFTVHDRGGAIQQLGNGVDRLDVWAGHGEEGLARALAFGLQSVKGTVYPPGSMQPPEAIVLEDLPAPVNRLQDYLIHGENLMAMKPKLGERGLSVAKLQEYLRTVGHLDHVPTGFFGPKTHESLMAFLLEYQLNEATDVLTENSAAHLLAASRRHGVSMNIREYIDAGASRRAITQSQRILRFLGYYKGRTDGKYSDDVFAAILRFQQDQGLVGSAENTGAGRIGPLTKRALHRAWNREIVARKAQQYLAFQRVEDLLSKRGQLPDRFLDVGNMGPSVKLLQTLLAKRGFFPLEEVNGNFGPLTKEAVTQYQLDRGIISRKNHPSAGYVGRSTLSQLRSEEKKEHYQMVRGGGWGSI